MDINEQILNSINILIKAVLQDVSFDKTVKAIITYCGDNNKYKCNYQGSIYNVTSLNNDKYKIGDYVYVLIPASDDNYSAISAALDGDEYVITTSSKQVKAGEQVRLANEQ